MTADARWTTALGAAALLAVDPEHLGGATLRAPAGPARDAWLAALRGCLDAHNFVAAPPLPPGPHHSDAPNQAANFPSPLWGGVRGGGSSRLDDRGRPFSIERAGTTPIPGPSPQGGREAVGTAADHRDTRVDPGHGAVPWRRLPPGVAEGRLIGGLDLAATLAAGRPVAERGLLAEAAGGVLVVPMAERLGRTAAGLVAAALDTGEIVVERDGIAARTPARFACVLLDEGIDDERAPAALEERLAFRLDLHGVRPLADPGALPSHAELAAARARLPAVAVDADVLEAVAGVGLAFGVPSLRVASLALHAARAAAALAGRGRVMAEDVELAAALVIAPRATTLPAPSEPDTEEAPPTQPDEPPLPPEEADFEAISEPQPQDLTDLVVEAARAAIPPGLLAALSLAAGAGRAAGGGRAGIIRASAKRGRPAGVRRGVPGHGVRLAVVETLRAAAPWQRLRRATAGTPPPPGRILVRREDFRIARFKEKSETLTLFVVDASGSAALHRLAEVKGAVELILAECYVRRDEVALIVFRGANAELILPPTRSLVRAKRALAGQAGGGGTPLAAAVELAAQVTDASRRRGQMPVAVFLTDGKANIGRAGRPGRAEAEADALAAARLLRAGGAAALVLDIAPRPGESAVRLAAAMGARYIPLPYADAQTVSRAVMAATPRAGNA